MTTDHSHERPGAPAARPGSPGPPRGYQTWAVRGLLAAAMVAVASLLAADALAPTAPARVADPATARQSAPDPVAVTGDVGDVPASGSSWCPVTTEGEVELLLTAVGDQAGEATVVRHGDADGSESSPVTVEPGEPRGVPVDGTDPLEVRWRDAPVAVSWQPTDAPTSAMACPHSPSDEWHVPGLATTHGSTSTLHLFNPHGIDAVVGVVFATEDGPEHLVRTDGIAVPAGEAVALEVDELLPEQPELAASVEVQSGRVIAAGERTAEIPEEPAAEDLPEVDDATPDEHDDATPDEHDDEPSGGREGGAEGLRGRVLLAAAPGPSARAHAGYAAVSDRWDSWLVVQNPGDRAAAVQVRVTDPSGDASLEETDVPAGAVARIDLADRSRAEVFSVTVESRNDVPVAVAALSASRGGSVDPDARHGLGGGVLPDRARRNWLVNAPPEGPRNALVVVHNPGAEPAHVDVDAGAATPRSWTDHVLEPNERRLYDLGEVDETEAPVPVRVSSDQPVVATHRSTTRASTDVPAADGDATGSEEGDGSDAGAVIGLAVGGRTWEPPARVLPARHDAATLGAPGLLDPGPD